MSSFITTRRGIASNMSIGFAGAAALAGVVIASMLAGCSRYREDEWSRQWPTRLPTGGLVTLNGAPVAEAVVTLSITRADRDNKAFTAVGMTDPQGRFVLRTFRPGDGAVEGKHTVAISKSSMEKGTLVNEIPSRFARVETSGLTAEVTAKTPNELRFDLSAK